MKLFRVFLIAILVAVGMSAHASSCFQDPEGEGGNQQKKQQRDQMMKEMEDPAQDLLMCFLQTAIQGPEAIIKDHCGCKESIDKLCDFDYKNGKWKVSAKDGADKAWCAAFLPAMI